MNLSWLARLTSLGRRAHAPDESDVAPILPWAVRRDVLILISIKLAVLAAIYWLFFAPHVRPAPAPADITRHLLDPQLPDH
jgi:hypothetical protein